VRAGTAAARITLSPPSLGGLRITVTQTPTGLLAHLIAENPETGRLLAANQGELRSALGDLGLPLLSLQIGAEQGGGGSAPQPRRTPPKLVVATEEQEVGTDQAFQRHNGLTIDLVA